MCESGSEIVEHWSPWCWEIETKDLPDLEKEAKKRLQQVTLELAAAKEVLSVIRRNWAWSILFKRGIHHGDRVIVDYSDGPVQAIFEGVQRSLDNQIVLRHLTKKGEPQKSRHLTSWDMANFIQPVKAAGET